MKKVIENFFGMPFEQALREKGEFTLITSAQSRVLDIKAMVYFNLAKLGWSEEDPGYREAKQDELNYLSGIW